MAVHTLKTGKVANLRSEVSPEEWQARVDLAACYRLMDLYGMSDLIANHVSVRVPGEHDAFLINAYGLLYEEITASSLIKIDHEGKILSKPEFVGGAEYGVNRAGFARTRRGRRAPAAQQLVRDVQRRHHRDAVGAAHLAAVADLAHAPVEEGDGLEQLVALALPAQVLIKALSPAFFARGDTLTPLWATLKGLAMTIVLAILLGRLFSVPGIAVAIALGGWSGALALIRRGASTFGFSIDAAARRRLPRIVAAALAMGGLLWLTAPFALASADASVPLHLLLVAALVAGGIAAYGLFLALLGVIRWNEAIGAFRRSSL